MENKLKVLLHLKRSESNVAGECPILGRITVGTTTAQFRTKLMADSRRWDARAGRLAGKSSEAVEINEKLNRINVLIFLRYEELLAQRGDTTAQEVKNAFQGIAISVESLLACFVRYNEEYRKRIGIDRMKGTWEKYNNSLRHTREFIRIKYKLDDIPLRGLTPSFIDDFDFYLRYDRKLSSGTITQIIWPLQKIVRNAMSEGLLFNYPFAHYEHIYEAGGIKHLSQEELHRFMNTQLGKHSLYLIRDMFVLSCFTGLSYSDMLNLTPDNLTVEDGMHWIRTFRQKTGVDCNIPLLDIPLGIINKYRGSAPEGRLLPIPGNDTMNKNLKKIAAICDIDMNLTVHVSRHTFATEVAISNGISLESVSSLLGHADIRTTQIYAKVTNEKIDRDMMALEERIANKFQIAI